MKNVLHWKRMRHFRKEYSLFGILTSLYGKVIVLVAFIGLNVMT